MCHIVKVQCEQFYAAVKKKKQKTVPYHGNVSSALGFEWGYIYILPLYPKGILPFIHCLHELISYMLPPKSLESQSVLLELGKFLKMQYGIFNNGGQHTECFITALAA